MKISYLKSSKKRTNAGFSLLEILVSVAILASVLTGIMLMLSYSIKSDSEAKMRTVAKDLVQEGSDIFRRERDRLGWSMVYSQIYALPYNEFCLNTVQDEPADDNIFNDLSMGDSCSFGINVDGASQPFKRIAIVSLIADQEIKVVMMVSWENDTGDDHFISSTLLLKPW